MCFEELKKSVFTFMVIFGLSSFAFVFYACINVLIFFVVCTEMWANDYGGIFIES